MAKEFAAELELLAREQLERIDALLPSEPAQRAVIFIEVCRILDAHTVNPLVDESSQYGLIDNRIIHWGWNPAAALLLAPLKTASGVPLAESTKGTRSSALELLRVLGCNVLLRRVMEMVRGGLMSVRKVQTGYVIEAPNEPAITMLQDNLDPGLLNEVERRFNIGQERPYGSFRRADIDDLMLPLMRPWRTPRGTMLAYDAIPEVDQHFLAEALELATKWKQEAGIHQDTRLGDVTASDLLAFAVFFASFHLKHAKFVSLAAQNFPEISAVQSLTIWKSRTEFVNELADYAGFSVKRMKAIVEAIAFRADEAPSLKGETTPLRPLLIDLGNGFDLWPVAALGRNPFETIRRIHERRDPSAVAKLSAPREAWLRNDLYALFQGNRYERVDGNIKVKIDGRILTDIDAAVYDRVADELALFQIKWQDFSTDNPKELRSKATNFMEAMNAWSSTVEQWLCSIGVSKAMQALRLRPVSNNQNTKVHLFGLSRSAARLGPLARRTRPPSLALANWPQFLRARWEIGPADEVLSSMHRRLIEEYEIVPDLTAMPIILDVGGQHIEIRDVFFRTNDVEASEINSRPG